MHIKINQIYFNDETESNCYDWTIHIDNANANASDIKYFENKVISNLIDANQHLDCDYFGVWSHAFKFKVLQNPNYGRLNRELLESFISNNNSPDVVGFFAKFKQTSIFAQAESYHRGFNRAFSLMLKYAIGLEFCGLKHAIYIMQNHFIAKPELYGRYVNEMLNPCIEVLENKAYGDLQELIWNPVQKYSNQKERFKQNPRLQAQLGGNYPLHPFLLERLPSLFFTLEKNENEYNYASW